MEFVKEFIRDHFNELVLLALVVWLSLFIVDMSRIHNDALASKGDGYLGQAISALFAIMAAKRLQGPTPPKE